MHLFPLHREYSVYTMLFFYNPTKCFCVIPDGTNMSIKPLYRVFEDGLCYLHNATGVGEHVMCDWR